MLSLKYIMLIAGILLLGACKQDQLTCVRHFTLLPCSVAFVGFQPEELDTIICARYKANTSFIQLLGTDTLLYDTLSMQHDTAYTARINFTYSGFFNLGQGTDYQLRFPGNPKVYSITGIA